MSSSLFLSSESLAFVKSLLQTSSEDKMIRKSNVFGTLHEIHGNIETDNHGTALEVDTSGLTPMESFDATMDG